MMRLVMRGLVPRIHAEPFRRLTRNGKVIDIARHFLEKSLAVPLGVDGRHNPRVKAPGLFDPGAGGGHDGKRKLLHLRARTFAPVT